MSEPTIEARTQTPGIVIFTAILEFIISFFLFMVSAFCMMVLIFGNIMSVYEVVTKRLTQVYGQPNLSVGINFIFGMMLVFTLLWALFYLWLGIGLLKGKKLAWYFQIAFSTLGLLGFPFSTAVNIVILIFFFQSNVRSYFKA